MNKKAQAGGTLPIITKAILVLVVLVIMLVIFYKFFGQGASIIDTEICGLDHDQDGDGIIDLNDKCPCDPGEPSKCVTPIKECRSKIAASPECKSRR